MSTDQAGAAQGRTRAPVLDAVCAQAVDLARDAAVQVAGDGQVGEHLGAEASDERVVTHRFRCLLSGYVGWDWSVTVARAARARNVTVDEVCLLPGVGALLAPPWLPYADRLRPGDLGPGDLLPVPADDDRLQPGWTGGFAAFSDDDAPELEVARLAWELGVTRPRVLSVLGLDDAADRWVNGSGGPQAALAQSSPAHCASCGFWQPLGGLLGHAFGACANEHSPSDGRVVTFDHGCGAHSEAAAVPSLATAAPVVWDSLGYDLLGPDPLAPDRRPLSPNAADSDADVDAAADGAPASVVSEPAGIASDRPAPPPEPALGGRVDAGARAATGPVQAEPDQAPPGFTGDDSLGHG